MIISRSKTKFKLARKKSARQNSDMRLEHCALQVPDPAAMADWYVKHLGCTVARSGGAPGHARFLRAGPVLIEIYEGTSAPTPDYPALHPALLHLAFVSENLKADRDRLVAAGAKIVDDYFTSPAGDQLVMLRDPWGIALQLVKREAPMLF
jgi:catechol 2,3-dioxygenase-like lactoylglutathione lyase family enzyme